MNILDKMLYLYVATIRRWLCSFFIFSAHATSITLPYNFTAGSPISASQMMGNFASITSAISSTVSSPWVASSSNFYYNAGAVGIGSSAPTRALDVSGSVSVSSIVVGSGSPVTIAYRQGGDASNFAVAGTTNYSISANLKMLFGRIALPTSTGGNTVNVTVTFPVAFVNPPHVMISNSDFGASALTISSTGGSYVGSFTIYSTCMSGSSTPVVNWIAIGW